MTLNTEPNTYIFKPVNITTTSIDTVFIESEEPNTHTSIYVLYMYIHIFMNMDMFIVKYDK